jgi:hypothetical protein
MCNASPGEGPSVSVLRVRLPGLIGRRLWTARRQWDGMPKQTFNGTELLRIFRRHKTRSPASGLHPGRAADSMDVIFWAIG